MYNLFPRIQTVLDENGGASSLIYSGQIQKVLHSLLPDNFFSESADASKMAEIKTQLEQKLPLFKEVPGKKEQKLIHLFLLCRQRYGVSKFFYDMVSRWLIPGKQLNVALFFSTTFQLLDLGDETYSISEMILSFEHPEEYEMALSNMAYIEQEILFGVQSYYLANHILKIKGLSLDDKTTHIQERIADLVRHYPRYFDDEIFEGMQQFLISCKDIFKLWRNEWHLCRIICIFHIFKKYLQRESELNLEKRLVCLKIKKVYLNHPFGTKEVLSFFVGINVINEYELFEERHLLSAINRYIPQVQMVEHSLLLYKLKEEKIQLFYLEIEKKNNEAFSWEEVDLLRELLPDDLKNRVEHLVPPLFMPRNEEEVMRNILTLSQQIKYLKDIPQMIISFEEQTEKELAFTVILVRILYPESEPVKQLFLKGEASLKIFFERVKNVGMLRRKYPKEANVLRIKLTSADFVREDYAVDLFQARLKVAQEIQRIVGEVRDYNGGMISKQQENFKRLRQMLGEQALRYPVVLQNFFYSITPIELSATLDPQILKQLYLLIIQGMEHATDAEIQAFHEQNSYVFAVFKFQLPVFKQKIMQMMETLSFSFSREILQVEMKIMNNCFWGFVYLGEDLIKQEKFLHVIENFTSTPALMSP